MKIITILLLFAIGTIQAQTVSFSDNFKQALLAAQSLTDANDQWVDIDPDNDGVILLADVLLVETISIIDPSLTDVTNINAFANLRWLGLQNCNITTIDLSGLSQLYSFNGDGNPLTSFNAHDLPSLQSLYISDTDISSLQISNCPALTDFWTHSCSNLTSIEASGLPQLSFATMTNCPSLLSVNLSACPILEYLEVNDSFNIETLDLSGNPSLTDLGTLRDHHAIRNLDISSCTNLSILWIEGPDNALENINLENCPAMSNLILSSTKLTSIDFSGAPNVNYLMVGGLMPYIDLRPLVNPGSVIAQILTGLVESVDVGPFLTDFSINDNPITALDLSAATRLQSVDCANTPISYLNLKNGSTETNLSINSFALQYVCADEGQVTQVQALVPASVAVSSYCSFIPGGDYNIVSGDLRLDSDLNGCSPLDFGTQYVRVDISDGTAVQTTFTSNGQYRFYPSIGSYTITPVLQNPAFYTTAPAGANVNFTTLNQTTIQDFCIVPNGFQPDLDIVVTPTSTARPGFDTTYKLVYHNKGNVMLSGGLTFGFDEATADFVAATPVQLSLQPGLAQFTFSNLMPLETRAITITLHLNAPTDTPPLNGGNIFNTTAVIDHNEGEITPADNSFTLHQTLLNALDPNDKSCLEGETLSPDKIGEYLHYNINFENVGTAEAFNVVVRDVLNTAQFDLASLQLLYASHPVSTRLSGNMLEFIFEDINLPASALDPIGGHGNVLFKIKTLPTLQSGDVVTNRANIYFDYNHPIQTNEARTTFSTLSSRIFKADDSVSMHPNPAQNTVNIEASTEIKLVELFDVQGRILQRTAETATQISIDLSSRAKGIYFLHVTTQKGSKVLKLVKD